mmetsp:Transcript_142004/g.247536  ORF Transcript_142004/g.247536 Transcript_142004/m.247536 type:complete len:357 (+) Transcript_142004:328-1398(+)
MPTGGGCATGPAPLFTGRVGVVSGDGRCCSRILSNFGVRFRVRKPTGPGVTVRSGEYWQFGKEEAGAASPTKAPGPLDSGVSRRGTMCPGSEGKVRFALADFLRIPLAFVRSGSGRREGQGWGSDTGAIPGWGAVCFALVAGVGICVEAGMRLGIDGCGPRAGDTGRSCSRRKDSLANVGRRSTKLMHSKLISLTVCPFSIRRGPSGPEGVAGATRPGTGSASRDETYMRCRRMPHLASMRPNPASGCNSCGYVSWARRRPESGVCNRTVPKHVTRVGGAFGQSGPGPGGQWADSAPRSGGPSFSRQGTGLQLGLLRPASWWDQRWGSGVPPSPLRGPHRCHEDTDSAPTTSALVA